MRYFVTLYGTTFEIDLRADEVLINGKAVAAELAAVPGTPVRRLLVNGSSHAVHVMGGDTRGEWNFQLDGERYTAEVVDQRTHAIRGMTGRSAVAAGPKPLKAPMPGLIVRVEVGPGDQVSAGQGVVIIEAMKMQNELKAESGGVVRRVLVEPGSPVEKGAVLIEFEDPKPTTEAPADA